MTANAEATSALGDLDALLLIACGLGSGGNLRGQRRRADAIHLGLRLRQQAQRDGHLFPRAVALVERGRAEVGWVAAARGRAMFARPHLRSN